MEDGSQAVETAEKIVSEEAKTESQEGSESQSHSKAPKYLVDAKELISSEVNSIVTKMKAEITEQVTKTIVDSVNEQLKEKIALEVANFAPADPDKEWMEKIVDMASKKKFFSFK